MSDSRNTNNVDAILEELRERRKKRDERQAQEQVENIIPALETPEVKIESKTEEIVPVRAVVQEEQEKRRAENRGPMDIVEEFVSSYEREKRETDVYTRRQEIGSPVKTEEKPVNIFEEISITQETIIAEKEEKPAEIKREEPSEKRREDPADKYEKDPLYLAMRKLEEEKAQAKKMQGETKYKDDYEDEDNEEETETLPVNVQEEKEEKPSSFYEMPKEEKPSEQEPEAEEKVEIQEEPPQHTRRAKALTDDAMFEEIFQKARASRLERNTVENTPEAVAETTPETPENIETVEPPKVEYTDIGKTKEIDLSPAATKEVNLDEYIKSMEQAKYTPPKETTGEIPFSFVDPIDESDVEGFTDTSELKVDAEKAYETSRLMNLGGKINDEFREFFKGTVAVTPDAPVTKYEEEQEQKVTYEKKDAGDKEDEQEYIEEEEFVAFEYNSPDDAEEVSEELASLSGGYKLRTVITGVASAVLLYLALTSSFNLPLPSIFTEGTPFYLILANILLLAIAMLISISTIIGGLAGLFKNATADSLTAISALGALIQAVYYIVRINDFATGFVLFAPVAVIALFCNAYGKSIMAKVVADNFEDIAHSPERNVAYRLEDEDLTYKLSKGLGENEPSFLSSRPTAFMQGFLKHSFSERASDSSSRIMAILVLVSSIASAIFSYVYGKNIAQAVSSFAAMAVLGGTFSATLISAVPAKITQRMASKIGAVIPGWGALQEVKDINVVAIQDKDLFPEGTVVLHGIKTFEKERIDLAILYAASVLIEGSPTLRNIFLSVIEDNRSMLYPVENLQYESGCGFTAWIENNRVIVGNREMMKRYEIDVPSLDYENKFTKNGQRQPIYLSVLGKLFGMFVVSYHPDETVAETLYDLERSGIAVAVRGRDFCITSELVSKEYDIPAGYIKVLSSEEQEWLAPHTEHVEAAEGTMAHIDSFASLIGGLRAALAGYSMEKMSIMLQWVATVLSVAVGLFLSITGGLPRISVVVICLYLGVWAVISTAVPAIFKKY